MHRVEGTRRANRLDRTAFFHGRTVDVLPQSISGVSQRIERLCRPPHSQQRYCNHRRQHYHHQAQQHPVGPVGGGLRLADVKGD